MMHNSIATLDASNQHGSLHAAGDEARQTSCEGAIENYVGTVQVPVGLTPEMSIEGRYANGRFALPLATTEAALVASYSRGIRTMNEAGGCRAALVGETINRAPAFAFAGLHEAVAFTDWIGNQFDGVRQAAESTTRHGALVRLEPVVEGNHVYLDLAFTVGEAAGQNMITFATEAALAFIHAHSPIRPKQSYVEGNLSGDKKATARTLSSVRGKRVSAEIVIPAPLVEERLNVTVEALTRYWRVGAIGSMLAGAIGAQGHFANALAALYVACGQDAACVAESAVGITRMEIAEDGALYAAVTLPNIVIGTVGGGTGLESQRGYLNMIGLPSADGARALAEIVAGLCLAGELSIMAAITAGEFSAAHRNFAREKKISDSNDNVSSRS